MEFINIRKATLKDSEFIASNLLIAMKDILYKFIGENNQEKAKEFLLYFSQRENNQYSYQNCWVVEDRNEVIAAVNIYNGAKLNALRKPIFVYIKNHYNNNLIVEEETHAG